MFLNAFISVGLSSFPQQERKFKPIILLTDILTSLLLKGVTRTSISIIFDLTIFVVGMN